MNEEGLPRRFGFSTATFVVVASMVGSGILISPGYMITSLGSYWIIFALWIIGGMLALGSAMCVAELAAALPRAGGEYIYLREAYGPLFAFLSGWTSFIIGFSAALAINAHVCATFILAPFFDDPGPNPWTLRLVATLLIIGMTIPNLLGHRPSAWTQDCTTCLKVLLFVALVIGGFLFGTGSMSHLVDSNASMRFSYTTAAAQLFYVMFAYSGWNAATYISGEVKDPGTTLPRSLILGASLVVVLYIAVNLIVAYALGPAHQVALDRPDQAVQVAAERLFGTRISSAFSVAVGVSFLATLSAFIVTGPRIYYAMAKDGLFPKFAIRISHRWRVPALAMIAQSVLAVVILIVGGGLELIYKYTSVGLGAFSVLIIASVIVLRIRAPELPRPYRVPGYPFLPFACLLLFIFGTAFALWEWPGPSTISLVTIAGGVLVYWVWRRIRKADTS
jgi:APA family basic amino acid/polyamine antiporter